MPSPTEQRPLSAADPAAGRVGGLLVMGLLLLGIVAATLAIAFQRGQTERCLAFYGTDAAAAIARAKHVELWRLAEENGRLTAVGRTDISTAKGLVHLRRGLVEDANFNWDAGSPAGDGSRQRPGAGRWSLPSRRQPQPATGARGSCSTLAMTTAAGGSASWGREVAWGSVASALAWRRGSRPRPPRSRCGGRPLRAGPMPVACRSAKVGCSDRPAGPTLRRARIRLASGVGGPVSGGVGVSAR